MLSFLKKQANKTFTENGAVTYASTCSDCLDLFAAIGALRRESDEGAGAANFEYAKNIFSAHGYELPHVVFWNVASRSRQQPVTKNEQGAALVSGCTPRIFSMLRSGTLNPYAYMLEILGSERYQGIAA